MFVKQSDLKEETDFRIAPPKANMGGLYFQECTVWWINKKHKIVSFATFGQPCVIQEEIDAARALEDPELDALLDDTELLSKKTEYHIPGFILNAEFDDKGVPVKVSVADDKCKVLQCGPMLMKAINRVVTSRNVQNGTEDGIADREKGFNMLITKTGKKLSTEYNVAPWRDSYEMPKKYYDDAKIPDVVKMAKNSIDSEEYQIGVIRNYLYGEPMPEKAKKEKDEPAATAKSKAAEPAAKKVAAPVRNSSAAAKTTSRGAAVKEKDEDADEGTTATATRGGRTAAASTARSSSTGRRSLVDDVDNLDD